MLIGSEKPLWGEFNKLLYCIVLYILDSIIKTFLSGTLFVTFLKCWHAYKSTFQKIEKKNKGFLFCSHCI